MTIAEHFEKRIEAARDDKAALKKVFDDMINEAVGGLVILRETGTGVQYPPFAEQRAFPYFQFADKSRYEFRATSSLEGSQQ